MKNIVIVDIDGTVADIKHRLYHIMDEENKDWDTFNDLMDEDSPKEDIIQLVQTLRNAGMIIILATGRFGKYRKTTEKWLQKHSIPYQELWMRKGGDYRSDFEVKQDMLDEMGYRKDNILLVIDDRESVVEMWRENGLTCLQCQKGDY